MGYGKDSFSQQPFLPDASKILAEGDHSKSGASSADCFSPPSKRRTAGWDKRAKSRVCDTMEQERG